MRGLSVDNGWLVSFQRLTISWLVDDFKAFLIVAWHCTNFVEGRTRLIPYLDLFIIKLLRVALMGSSSHRLMYLETMPSRFSTIQVFRNIDDS